MTAVSCRRMGAHAACFCFIVSCVLLFNLSASAYPPHSLASKGLAASMDKVTLQVHHRDSPSSPVRSKLASDEERLQTMFAREEGRLTMGKTLDIYQMASHAATHHANAASSASTDADLWQGPRQRDPSTSALRIGPTMGEFVTTVSVGTPAREMHVILDITAGITWLQCETCRDCFRQPGAAFDPNRSSSYASVDCITNMCYALPLAYRQCIKQACGYSMSYTDGTLTMGSIGSDTFFFGSPQVNLTGVPFGCSTNTTTGNGILTQVFDGVLSLGMGQASITALFLPQFSYCLPKPFSSNGGYLTLGGADPQGNGTVSFNFYQNAALPAYYYVPVIGISISDKVTADTAPALARTRAGAGVVLDFSRLISYLVPKVYTSLKEVFRLSMEIAGFKLISPMPQGVPSYLETCYSLPMGLSLTAGLPPVKLLLEGGFSVPLSPKNYLVSAGHNMYCFAFVPAAGSAALAANVSVLGSAIQLGFDVSFDLASKRISLTPNAC